MQAAVGDSIEVFWPLDKAFYSGRIVAHNLLADTFSVRYDDGEVEDLDLSLETWRFQENTILNADHFIPAKAVNIEKDRPHSLALKPKTLTTKKSKSMACKGRKPEWSRRIDSVHRLIHYCTMSWSRNHTRCGLPKPSFSVAHCLSYVFDMLSVAASNPAYYSKLARKVRLFSRRPRGRFDATRNSSQDEPTVDAQVDELISKAPVSVYEEKIESLPILTMSVVLHAIYLSKQGRNVASLLPRS